MNAAMPHPDTAKGRLARFVIENGEMVDGARAVAIRDKSTPSIVDGKRDHVLVLSGWTIYRVTGGQSVALNEFGAEMWIAAIQAGYVLIRQGVVS